MRVPHTWLSEVVHKAAPQWSVTAEELDKAFVDIGFEVEDLVDLDQVTGPLVVGRVESIELLEGFKKPIRFCLVNVGADTPQEIVCGATNFVEGDLVVVALPGAVLPGGFAIATRKTYGRTSAGMICSVSELGLGRDHSGIQVLAPGTAEPGADAIELLGLRDTVIELDVTPDRGYCMSVRGLTRELSCGADLDYADPAVVPALPAEGPAWGLSVSPDSGCTRFALRRITGINPAAVSPWWLQRRLVIAGIRPISPAVDVTNYVMMELGQPLHAFDSAALRGDLVVRRADAGETLDTLDGVTRTLDESDVVIADESGAVSLAGVMGGATTEVNPQTTDILLEAAIWNPVAVFRTGRRHKLSSEAAKRYERVVDPALPAAALDRAAALLAEITGGVVEPVLTDWTAPQADPVVVTMEIDLPDRVAGVTYAPGTVIRRLQQIGAAVEIELSDEGRGVVQVTPPTWRPDLRQSADLVEEVLRLEGLELIPSVVPPAPVGRGLTPGQLRRRSIGKALASSGYVEVPTSPFLPTAVFDQWGLSEGDARRRTLSVLNPLEADRPELATTLLPAMLEVLGRNVSRGFKDLSLFNIAQVVLPSDATGAVDPLPVDRRPTEEELATLNGSLPAQPVHVAAVLTGLREPSGIWGPGRPADAADAFEAARIVARAADVELRFVAAQVLPWHPGRCAELFVGDVSVGYAGELHPAVLERAGLPARTCAVEIDMDLLPLRESLPAPTVSPYPAVLQDVAVVVDTAVTAAEVESALSAGAGELLESIRLFDIFAGEQVGEGKKSLAFALRFRATDRTLTEDEASAARDAAVAEAGERVGAALR